MNKLTDLANLERDDDISVAWDAAEAIRNCLKEFHEIDGPFIADRMVKVLHDAGFELEDYRKSRT